MPADAAADAPPMPSILFVCLGNICRSPTAEAVFRAKAAAAGLDAVIDSAGTGGWHIGEPPDPRAREAGEAAGYSFDGQSGRQVTRTDFAQYDYILAMDRSNLIDLEAMKPPGYSGHLGLFLDFASTFEGVGESQRDVPDPYYGGRDGFKTVVALIENASEGLIAKIKSGG